MVESVLPQWQVVVRNMVLELVLGVHDGPGEERRDHKEESIPRK